MEPPAEAALYVPGMLELGDMRSEESRSDPMALPPQSEGYLQLEDKDFGFESELRDGDADAKPPEMTSEFGFVTAETAFDTRKSSNQSLCAWDPFRLFFFLPQLQRRWCIVQCRVVPHTAHGPSEPNFCFYYFNFLISSHCTPRGRASGGHCDQ
jgi:hypothetical protein